MSLHDHPPKWAGGPCGRCGAPWPCFERQLASMAEFHGHPADLLSYMNGWLEAAFPALERRGLQPDPDLEERHLGWIWAVSS